MPKGFIETPNTVRMTLLFEPSNGQFNIEGPIDNKILAYGLLELAKEAIFRHNYEKEKGIGGSAIMLPIPLPRRGS